MFSRMVTIAARAWLEAGPPYHVLSLQQEAADGGLHVPQYPRAVRGKAQPGACWFVGLFVVGWLVNGSIRCLFVLLHTRAAASDGWMDRSIDESI